MKSRYLMGRNRALRITVKGVVMRAAVLAGCLVTACQVAGPRDPVAAYSLEIVNDAADRVQVNIRMGSTFLDVPIAVSRDQSMTGIISLASGEKRTYMMSSGIGEDDTQEDGYLVRRFREIHFFDTEESVRYRSYEYELIGCGNSCGPGGDDTLFLHERSDGVEERLFMESPDRPFYLEWDKDDRDLGRIVITFVPSVEDGAENGQVAARR